MGIRFRNTLRQFALTIAAPGIGFLLILVLEMSLDIEVSKLISSLFNLVIVAPIAFILFPGILGIPFGQIGMSEWRVKLGLFIPKYIWKHVLLGLVLAGCTLSGMLIASLLTGRYVTDSSKINLAHIVFSLNPALWEELFYRGVLMILLLKATHSVGRAFLFQVLLFSIMHIKGIDLWAIVDTITVGVLAVGFTYAALKTNVLVAGIIFHFFHDALLFFVQVPEGHLVSLTENLLFYGLLWLMVGLGCLITKLSADRFGTRAPAQLYVVENT